MKIIKRVGLLILTVVLLAGCDGYEKLLKSHDYEKQYEAAVSNYENHNYTRAIQLLENLIMHYHGKEHAEEISWYYAQALMGEKDYFSASYQFKNHHKRFPYSVNAEEALYLAATCKYYNSPKYNLDQKITKEAISEYESYVDRYPGSVHIPEINTRLDELRGKLIQKEYEIAYNYYVIEQYNAAYVSLQAFLNNYPESQYKEQAMFYMLASGYQYGINSQESKVRERLQQVISDFDRFAVSFSESTYLEQAREIYTKARAALAKIDNQK